MVKKEIVFHKNSTDGVIKSYDIIVFGNHVGKAMRKTVVVDNFKSPKVSWLLQLKDSQKDKEFSSVKLIRSHILHGLINGRWGSDEKNK